MALLFLAMGCAGTVQSSAPDTPEAERRAGERSTGSLPWEDLAELIVERMDLARGEQVLVLGVSGRFEAIVPPLERAIRQTGAVYLAQGNGPEVRLYDLLPRGPAILAIGSGIPDEFGDPFGEVIRIGRSGYLDPSSLLSEVLRGRDGVILVRPDARVAWAGHRRDSFARAVGRALGWDGADASRTREMSDS